MQSTTSTTFLNRRVVRILQVAGGAVLIFLVVHNSELSFRNTLVDAASLTSKKRDLQGVRYDTTPGGQLQEQHYAWPPPRGDRERQAKHSHNHHNGGHERNTDDDDSRDDNDDDDSKDDHDDDEDDKDSSESQSSSGSSSAANETESSAIQSSVVTNLDGVNIGNTITIINIGTGSGGQQSSSATADNVPNPFAVNAAGRSAITSAAVRAFCDSIGCSPANGSATAIPVNGSGSTTFSWGGGNVPRGNEATYDIPVVSSGSTVVNLGLVKWLLFITMLILLV